MRDFKGMKRQRNRGRGGGGGGGGKPQHNANRAFDSNGPDGVKVRGAAQHIYEKYQQLARDAGSAGDRVLAENYLQHAEHYFRVLRAMQPQRPLAEIINRDQFASGYDIDFEEEPSAADESADQPELEGQSEARRDERPYQREDRNQANDFRQRDDRGDFRRDDRGQGEFRGRDDRPRDDRPREDRPREDGQAGEFRNRDDRGGQGEFRPRQDRLRDDRRDRFARDERRFQGDRPSRPEREYQNRSERDPLNVIEPQATPLAPAAIAPASASPFEPREAPGGGVLRGEDGAMSHAPAFLQPRPEVRSEGDDEAPPARRPRRRRAPRVFEPGEAAPAEADES